MSLTARARQFSCFMVLLGRMVRTLTLTLILTPTLNLNLSLTLTPTRYPNPNPRHHWRDRCGDWESARGPGH